MAVCDRRVGVGSWMCSTRRLLSRRDLVNPPRQRPQLRLQKEIQGRSRRVRAVQLSRGQPSSKIAASAAPSSYSFRRLFSGTAKHHKHILRGFGHGGRGEGRHDDVRCVECERRRLRRRATHRRTGDPRECERRRDECDDDDVSWRLRLSSCSLAVEAMQASACTAYTAHTPVAASERKSWGTRPCHPVCA